MLRMHVVRNLFLVAALTLQFTLPGVSGAACQTGYFQCDDGKCIFEEWRCDHYVDCDDSSDERNCPTSATCGPNDFTCEDSACITGSWKCDGEYDCLDSSDEKGCNCTDTQWRCPSGLCISRNWVCDGDNDCGDGADEATCSTPTPTPTMVTCQSFEFPCKNKLCIPDDWTCDTHDDCGDDSDEDPGFCGKRTCEPDHFTCHSGQCIIGSWKCDGEQDCEDNSDETNCPTPSASSMPSVRCPNQFECTDRKLCVALEWRCDAEPDCYDSSDELNCDACDSGFLCGDKECIADDQQCDGHSDCSGGKDEEGCPTAVATQTAAPQCLSPKMKCSDGKCIAETQVCNDVNDCSDGADETGCGNECQQGTHNCSRNEDCVDEARGFKCECKDGYEKDTSTGLCRDVDQCATIPGLCDHVCIDTIGSFKCECYPDFELVSTSTCKRTGPEPYLLFVYNRVIQRIAFTSENQHTVLPSLRSPLALDYNYREKVLYYADNFLHKIFVANLDGTGTQEVLVEGDGMDSPDGLAYDWIHHLLFWTDGHRETIERYDFRTKERRVLFNTSLDEPRAIVVDPFDGSGVIYFTDWGSPAKIEQATIDGKNRRVVSSQGLIWPNGLALDVYRRRLYWADAKQDHIKYIDLSSGNTFTVLSSPNLHPHSLALFDTELFWTDWNQKGILKVEVGEPSSSANSFSFVQEGLNAAAPVAIKVVHPHRQPAMESISPCGVNKGGCSHTCSVVNFKPECSCPDTLILWTDRKACLVPGLNSCPTDFNFCYNGGICSGALSCKCTEHYKGHRCETLVSLPCEANNGGCTQTCLNGQDNSAICKCHEGYKLLSDAKTCVPSSLQCPDYCISGTCSEGDREPQCECERGYQGLRCDVKIPTQPPVLPTDPKPGKSSSGGSGNTVGIAVGAACGVVLIIVIIIFVIILVKRQSVKGEVHFDNPVYINNTDEVSLPKHSIPKDSSNGSADVKDSKPSGTFI